MKIAIYGGAFNPVHNGHIALVKQLNKLFSFDKVLIIPSKFSPHKSNDYLVSDIHRLNMCKLAFNSIENCEVSKIEIERNDISYTVNTLKQIKNDYPNDELFLVCGSDMFLSLLKWKEPVEIFSLASIIGFKRDNESVENMAKYSEKLITLGAKVEICNVEIPAISSTYIRNAVKNNEKFNDLVDENVYEYIFKNGLYL